MPGWGLRRASALCLGVNWRGGLRNLSGTLTRYAEAKPQSGRVEVPCAEAPWSR